MAPLLIGAHTQDAGGLPMAAARAGAAGMRALQVFTAPPTFYNERATMKPARAARFAEALAAAGIAPRAVLVHAGYVLNPASPEPAKAERAAAALARELERTSALGALGCCFHPGSAGDGTVEEAIGRVAAAITRALRAVPGEARVLVENTAGAGRTVGRTAAEVGAILAQVAPDVRPRAGYGLDTCHLYASGHDLAASPAALAAVLDAFAEATGEPPAFFHLNDSEGALGSNRDRHALIGEGRIGAAPFGWLLKEPRARGVPLILETPQQRTAVADDDPSPDPWDVAMVRRLEGLAVL